MQVEFTVPVFRDHHHELHRHGNEAAWWANLQIAPLNIAKELWQTSPIHGAPRYNGSIILCRANKKAPKTGTIRLCLNWPTKNQNTPTGFVTVSHPDWETLPRLVLLAGIPNKDGGLLWRFLCPIARRLVQVVYFSEDAQPCLICQQTPSDPHHLKFAQPKALGRKVSDEFAIPLCRAHHQDLHRREREGLVGEYADRANAYCQTALGREPEQRPRRDPDTT